ncbi:hypothetical protein RGV33_12260 [Pseudomonas sp. Bout1]|uniref:hypothetical protein n=1 Tax=Pseudomonas sp. Bout1 TaxID=3048600 RepID=UPI002AB4A472|nr:hypothetical protein [Pseudomonas sp. Bout1]MDY7532441.1 hypothetical protein [Pseudomonas sp. Bout1]MEB0184125.1 hypothetical protein [Pseudomonas sp. Bout1]
MCNSYPSKLIIKTTSKPKKHLSGLLALLIGGFVFANSSTSFADENLDMYDAKKLIEQGKFKEAKTILLREEKTITDIGKLCSIYSSMLGIASISDNKEEGAQYANLFQKCYKENSTPYIFLGAMTIYFKGEHDKALRIMDKLLDKISNELTEEKKPDLHVFEDKNLVSTIYRLKASDLLIRQEPQKVKATIISFAEKSYEATPFGDAEVFLAAIYKFYGDTERSKSIIEKSDGRTTEAHSVDVILKSIKQKIDNASVSP